MKLQKALTYLDNVTKKSMAVPFRRYAGSIGRTAQGKYPRGFLHAGYVWWQRCQGIMLGGTEEISPSISTVSKFRTLYVFIPGGFLVAVFW